MNYEKFYPGGWQSGESGGTPITPEALDHIEQGIIQAYKDFAPAVESPDYPGCYYRTVDGAVEWLNPPMVLGVEYRTTERFNGRAVYKKMVNIPALPNNTELTVSHETTVLCPISMSLTSANNTVSLTGHKNITECKFNATSIVIATNANLSLFQAYALLFYTKNA